MVVSLRIHCTKLKVVLRKERTAIQRLSNEAVFIAIPAFVVFLVGRFHEWVEVEDKSLEVLWAFIEFPYFLVAAGDVVQHADYDVFVDGFTATCCILQDLLSLV